MSTGPKNCLISESSNYRVFDVTGVDCNSEYVCHSVGLALTELLTMLLRHSQMDLRLVQTVFPNLDNLGIIILSSAEPFFCLFVAFAT